MSEAVLVGLGALAGVFVGHLVTMNVARAGRKETLRLAAADKRLAVHQEAYAIWTDLLNHVHDYGGLMDRIEFAGEWWSKNCLYLDPKSRVAFKKGLGLAVDFPETKPGPEENRVLAELASVLELLARGVELPSLGDNEWATKPKQRIPSA